MEETRVAISSLKRVQPDSLVGVVFGLLDPRSPYVIVADDGGFVQAVSLMRSLAADTSVPPARFSVHVLVMPRNSRQWLTHRISEEIRQALRERFELEVTEIFQN